MTMRDGTLCTIIQGFPMLLILAQNHYRCLNTPFIYKPPSPTPSPEYIEALNTLYQHLYSHDHHGYGDHNIGGYGGSYGHGSYGQGFHGHETYGQGFHGHGTNGYGSYGSFGLDHKPSGYPVTYKPFEYPSSGHGGSYPGFLYKKVYNVSSGHKGYAPTHIHNVKNNYKIVVKKPKPRRHRKSQKLQGFFPNREERRQNFNFQNLLDPNRIRNRLTGILHLRPEDRDSNPGFIIPFRRPGGITNAQTGRPAYQDDQYGVNYQNYPNQYGNNVVFPTSPTNNQQYPNYGTNVNFYPNGNQYPNNGNDQYQPYNPNNQYPPYNNVQYPPNNQNYQQNPNNGQDIPNDPVNFEEPPSSEAPVDPVMIVDTPEDPVDNQKNPEQSGTLESGTLKPEEMPFTELPVLTPVPDTDKRNNVNFGSTGIFKETCQTVDNEIGSCISIRSCEPYLRLLQDSRSNPDAVQLLRRAHCGFEGNDPKVCCPRPGFPSDPATTSTTTTPQPETPPPREVAEPKSSGEYLDSFPAYPVCGKTGGALGRVVGGVPAPLGAFPWMALLGYKPKSGQGARWLCGGSLVSSRHVLTAAHCIHMHENNLFLVRLGELDLATESDGATPVDVLIKKLMKHEEYNHELHTNDIGLLWLDKDVQFTSLIRPICLPEANNLRSMTFDKYMPMVAGWGSIEYRGPTATHLQVVQLPVVSNSQCVNAYSKYTGVKIDQSIVCAGYLQGGKDACQGDSGGPLMQPIYNETNRQAPFYQIGVVSFGRRCAEAGFPGVYARVTYYMPWLQEKILGIAAQ